MTGGDAVLGGVSIQATHGCGRGLGYCPQVDPLNDHMTATEHLSMFARLKVADPPTKMLTVFRDQSPSCRPASRYCFHRIPLPHKQVH